MTIYLCAKCGEMIPEDSQFCCWCGEKVSQGQEMSISVPAGVTEIEIETACTRKEEYEEMLDDPDDIYIEVLRYAAGVNVISTSVIQTRFSLGYQRAHNILKWMEVKGFVSKRWDGKCDVLVTPDDVVRLYGAA